MFNVVKKLTEISSESEDEILDFVKRHAFTLSHNSSYVLGIWNYVIGSGAFELSTDKDGHLDDPNLVMHISKDRMKIVRGRVFRYKSLIFCIVYLDPDMSHVVRMSRAAIDDLKYRCQQRLRVQIDYVLTESGEILLSESQIKKEMMNELKIIK